jgi:hypothetical protein
LGGNNVAVGPSRHQAILHFAARSQLVSQPKSHHHQDNRDGQADDRATPVSAMFGVGHCRLNPKTVDAKYPFAATRYYHLFAPKMIVSSAILMASRRAGLYTAPDRASAFDLR